MLSCLTCASSLPWAVTGFHIGVPGMWPPAPPSKPSGPALESFSPSGNPDPIREPGSQLRVHIFQPSSCGQQPAHDSALSNPECSCHSTHTPLPPDLLLSLAPISQPVSSASPAEIRFLTHVGLSWCTSGVNCHAASRAIYPTMDLRLSRSESSR